MRRVLVVALLAAVAAPAPAAPAAPATVDVIVVGKSKVLRGPKHVKLKQRTVKVAGKRCRVLGATPLAVLAATKLKLGFRDYGSCGKRPADAVGLYVTTVAGEREKGRGGWVYKVGRKAGVTAAGDPAGPFGTGRRLRGGQKVTWFWCELKATGSCQRTLEAVPDRASAAPGETLRVTVRGYDDFGKGVAVRGATVRLGSASAVTGAGGVATLTVGGSGRQRLHAERTGMVRAFPRVVAVG
jgi:hypothetical protein